MDAVTFQQNAMQHERLMYYVSYSMLLNDQDCADAVQEALLRAWQKRGSLRDAARFRPWLMRILVNTCNDMLRRRSRRKQVSLEDAAIPAVPPEDPHDVWAVVALLKPALRTITVLHYLDGYSVAELAQTLGIPDGTVKSRLRSARKQLSVLLHDEWEGLQ